MKDTYFDIIIGVTPSTKDEQEFRNEMGKGVYRWLFDSSLAKKKGYFIPGYNDLLYNFVKPEANDYVLTIRLSKEKMKIDISQLTHNATDSDKIYSVETNFGTVGEKMITTSVPITDFDKYLMMAMDLRCEYYTDAGDALIDQAKLDKTEIEKKLNKLNEMNNK